MAAGGAVSGAGGLPVLWQLRFSHYNEKARFALDYKGIAHERRSLAAGPHRLRARRLWKGGTTPVLVLDGSPIGDTTAIIAELERRHPEPPLYPAGPAERTRALALEEHFDTELGPYVRAAVFDAILDDRRTVVASGTQGLGRAARAAQTVAYPLVKWLVRRELVDRVGGGEIARRKTLAALDRLEAELDGRDYLVGGSFTVADLTAAALFTPLVAPPGFPYELPDPWPPAWEEFRQPLRDRPGWRWVEETYRRHRGVSAATSER